MWFTRLKILPLLIFLSMAVFSLRVVQITDDISAITQQQAIAQEEERTAPAGLEAATKDRDTVFEVEDPTGAEDVPDEPQGQIRETRRRNEWIDATDSDLEFTDVKIEMFRDLSVRRESLDRREKELATREALLSAAEQELERKYQELAVIRNEIEILLQRQTEEEKQRIENLVKIYEGMKADKAAAIFNSLDVNVLVRVMSQMSERKISPILAQMNTERARTVTIMLSEQKRLPKLPTVTR